MLILAIDQRVRGEIDIEQFRAVLAQVRAYADPVRVLKPKRWKRKQPPAALLKPLPASKLLASTPNTSQPGRRPSRSTSSCGGSIARRSLRVSETA